MGAISNLGDALNRRTGGAGASEDLNFQKLDRLQAGTAPVALVVGKVTSLWGFAGTPAGVDVATGLAGGTTATNPTNATDGSLKQANPGGGRQKWVTAWEAGGTTVGMLTLYDRLMQCSGIQYGSTVTVTTITSGSVSRYTDGLGNEIWLEIYVALGATSGTTTVVASYTNQDGTAGRTTVAMPIAGAGLQEVGRMLRLPLQAGDKGVTSVQSVTVTNGQGAVGSSNYGVTIAHRLSTIPVALQSTGQPRDFVSGMPAACEVKTNAALALMWMAGVTTLPQIEGSVHSVEA